MLKTYTQAKGQGQRWFGSKLEWIQMDIALSFLQTVTSAVHFVTVVIYAFAYIPLWFSLIDWLNVSRIYLDLFDIIYVTINLTFMP